MQYLPFILGFSNIFICLVIIAISIPTLLNKIKMNKYYGIRIKKAFESEENWYKINSYGSKIFILWTVIVLVIEVLLILFFSNTIEIIYFIITAYVPFLIFIIPAIQLSIYCRKI